MGEILELVAFRKWYTDKSTISELYADRVFFCFTLEDKIQKDGVKVAGKTAIPVGKYKVILDQSVRFKREMPHILDVKGFEGVRIHSGNTDEDTEGCLLVGFKRFENEIQESRNAFTFLMERMKAVKEITLEIVEL
jgi:hypothetical protein